MTVQVVPPRRIALPLVALLSGLVLIGIGAAAAVPLLFELQGLTISSYSMTADGVTVGTAAFSQSASTVEPVALTSTNPGAASVPPSVPVIPPNDRVTFPVRGVAAGCTTIIVAYGGRSREKKIVVHPVNSPAAFSLALPVQVVRANGQVIGRVTTRAFSSAVVALSSSNPRVVSLPPRIETTRGRASFNISGHTAGCATISATVHGQTVRKTIEVVAVGG